MSQLDNSQGFKAGARNAKSAERTSRPQKTPVILPDDTTPAQTASFNKEIYSRFKNETHVTRKSGIENSKIFTPVTRKEKQTELASRELKYQARAYHKLDHENRSAAYIPKGVYGALYNPKSESSGQYTARTLGVRQTQAADEAVKRVRKSVNLGSQTARRDPILEGEPAKTNKKPSREFVASMNSQVQNSKKFFLPSEVRVSTCGDGSQPRPKSALRTFPSMRSIIQHDYVDQGKI